MERKEKEVFVEAERKEKESALAGRSDGPYLFDPAKLRAGPSVEEAARASRRSRPRSFAAWRTRFAAGPEEATKVRIRRPTHEKILRRGAGADARPGAELTRRARRGDAHLAGDAGSLVAMVRGASEVIRRACESAVREASGRE